MRENTRRLVDFLKTLRQIRFAPVFIFTAGPVTEVTDLLKKHPDLYDPSYIFIRTKDEVKATGVFNVLSDSLRQAPSAYVLKVWERQYENAKNQLFLDFYGKSVLWPLILWNTFEQDGVPPSAELGNLIGRNLLSRMTPFQFDLTSFDHEPLKALEKSPDYTKILRKVLEGERFIQADQLHEDSVAPGDVFKDGKHYLVNVRPDCDCIARPDAPQDSIELYLLEGSKLSSGQVHFDPEYGEIRERDTETIIFPMDEGASVSFRFKNLRIKTWGELKAMRIGRLVPPFLTRLQQRYSSYLQRPGLTRVPEAAFAIASTATPARGSARSQRQQATPSVDLRQQLINSWLQFKSRVLTVWRKITRSQ